MRALMLTLATLASSGAAMAADVAQIVVSNLARHWIKPHL